MYVSVTNPNITNSKESLYLTVSHTSLEEHTRDPDGDNDKDYASQLFSSAFALFLAVLVMLQ